MIKRFEDEYPETRLPSVSPSPSLPDSEQEATSPASPIDTTFTADGQNSDTEPSLIKAQNSDDEYNTIPVLSRHNSDVSLASKALSQEEGRMHRFGQKFRRDIIKAEDESGSPSPEERPVQLQRLRALIDGLGGDEVRKHVESGDQDAFLKELNNEASALRKLLSEADPEAWKKFVESQEVAERNKGASGEAVDDNSAME